VRNLSPTTIARHRFDGSALEWKEWFDWVQFAIGAM
jgi:hypothetical protein